MMFRYTESDDQVEVIAIGSGDDEPRYGRRHLTDGMRPTPPGHPEFCPMPTELAGKGLSSLERMKRISSTKKLPDYA